jgi:hypothetical protein
MSNINLGQFVRAGRSNETAELALRQKGGGSSLENTGTLGNKVVRFFRWIGEALHVIRPEPTREQQLQKAAKSFGDALRGEFGGAIAGKVLDSMDKRAITGRQARAAIAEAAQLRHQQQRGNQALIAEALPEPSHLDRNGTVVRLPERLSHAHAPPSDELRPLPHRFDDLCRQAGLEPSSLRPEQKDYYERRLTAKLDEDSENGRKALDEKTVSSSAVAVLKEIRKAGGNFDALDSAEKQMRQTARLWLQSMAKGGNAGQMVEAHAAFDTAMRKFNQLIDPVAGADTYYETCSVALVEALRSLPEGAGKDIARRMLSKDSPLAAVAQAAKTILSESSDGVSHYAGQMLNSCTMLLRSSSLLHGPVNASYAEDDRALGKVEASSKLVLQAREAILRASSAAS